MSKRESCRVSITVDDHGRGVFLLNGMDISNHVTSAKVETEAMKLTFVTFTVIANELILDANAPVEVKQAE